MILESKNLKHGDLLMLNLEKKINSTIDYFKDRYPELDLETQPFTYIRHSYTEVNKEVVSISWKHKDIDTSNIFYLEDFVTYVVPTQDNEFVKMMSSNERMIDLPV